MSTSTQVKSAFPNRGPFAVGPIQRGLIARMHAHWGWWPRGSSMTRSEKQAMKNLIKRGFVIKCDDQAFGKDYGEYYMPYYVKVHVAVGYNA